MDQIDYAVDLHARSPFCSYRSWISGGQVIQTRKLNHYFIVCVVVATEFIEHQNRLGTEGNEFFILAESFNLLPD